MSRSFRISRATIAFAYLLFATGASAGQPFAMQCDDDRELTRLVVRTNADTGALQFLGIECRRPNGATEIFKVGRESGERREIVVTAPVRRIGISRGICGGRSQRVCSIAFEFADGGRTGPIGRLTNTRVDLDGNGDVYGFFGEAGDDIDTLDIVTRKLHAEPDPNYDIAAALESIRRGMFGTTGFAAVIHDRTGQRVGFVRAGYAIHPLDERLRAHAGQFDIRTKFPVGSTAKTWASAAAALKADERSEADLLALRLAQVLPARWSEELHPRFRDVTVLDVIKHRAGFRHGGPNLDQTGGELPARFRLRTGEQWPGASAELCQGANPTMDGGGALPVGNGPPYASCYSNSSGGMLHFILPYMVGDPGIRNLERNLANATDAQYDRRISDYTGRFYFDFVQREILRPAGVEANCNIRDFMGSHQVAARYSGRSDPTGDLTEDNTLACAAGGWVISVADLAHLISQLASNDEVLAPLSRARMFNLGPERVWHITNADAHTHTGGRLTEFDDRPDATHLTYVARFTDGYVAVLAHNSPTVQGIGGMRLLLDAMRAARR